MQSTRSGLDVLTCAFGMECRCVERSRPLTLGMTLAPNSLGCRGYPAGREGAGGVGEEHPARRERSISEQGPVGTVNPQPAGRPMLWFGVCCPVLLAHFVSCLSSFF